MSKQHYLGIDLGGTHIAAGVVTADGQVLSKAERPTLAERHYEEVIRDMGGACLDALEKAGLQASDMAGIGIGIPGLADNTTGRVIFCTNLGWHDVPLVEQLQRYIQLPVYIDNDATVAGYAESVAGVSKGLSSSVFLTLGTGVGGGIVIGDKPWTGAHGVASEIGHLTIVVDGEQCTCGKKGCLERYCSATAIIRMARQRTEGKPDSAILLAAGGDPKKITARIVIDLAKQGDPLATEIFDIYTKYLAIAVNIITSFLDPEMVVLGGGVSHAGQFLLDHVNRKIPSYLMFKTLPYPTLALAELGNDAGLIGAALISRMSKGVTP